MGKKFKSYRVNHDLIYNVIGVLSVLAMIPLLVMDVQQQRQTAPSPTHHTSAIQSDLFKVFVYSSLLIGLQLGLDLTIDAMSNRVSMKNITIRAVITGTIVITSCQHIYFSLFGNNVVATWTIMHMRFIVTGVLTVRVILFRNFTVKEHIVLSYLMIMCWSVGTVLYSYHYFWHSLIYVGTLLRFIGMVIVFGGIFRHVYMVLMGKLVDEEWYIKWQQSAFEILLSLFLLVGCFIAFWWPPDYDTVDIPMIFMNIVNIVFLTFLCTIMTDEFRYNFNKVNNKLHMKRLFVRHVSHEFRTPLNCCLLGLKYLKSNFQVNKDLNKYHEIDTIEVLNEVTESCNTSLEFVNNLLMYEKIDTVELPLYLKREDLGALCRQVHKSFALSAREMGIALHLNIHKSLLASPSFDEEEGTDVSPDHSCIRPYSVIDGPKIVIVLRNLMSNALKFTPKGGSVTLSVKPVRNDTTETTMRRRNMTTRIMDVSTPPVCLVDHITHLRVVVSDTGRGMSQEEQEQLFSKIVQFNPNDSQEGGGSGIGLFLSHHIMKDHEMKIHVFSEGVENKGTSFYLDFPLCIPNRSKSSSSKSLTSDTESDKSILFGTLGYLCPPQFLNFCLVPRISDKLDSDEEEINDDDNIDGKPDISRFHPAGSSGDSNSDIHSSFSVNSLSDSRTLWRRKLDCLEDLTIMVVDDSSLNRKMIIRTLKQNRIGSSFDDFADGLELLQALGVESDKSDINVETFKCLPQELAHRYDVILLDDHMTHMNGSVAIKILRQSGYNGLVVGLTGNALKDELDSYCAAGVDYAMPKPFQVEDFIQILRQIF
jgi:signal transduction histidine kinase